jgi:AsmA-like C-terminal region/AsmA family
VRILRSPRGRVLSAILLLLALFLIRPGAGGLKTRISRSVSLAVGRQVEIGKVRLRMLPQPGFDLENFVVHDDPSFGAEPLLRAPDVSATIRLTSLLRGRLDVSSLSLTEPSVNLVRNREGYWNIENLLERTAKISVAPTNKARRESRPGFPYIEADRARINFKFEQEKTPYALTNADFSFWQDAENTWAMRLKAQPVRTDSNISDTGVLKISGSWQRAPILRETPLQFSVQWDRGQLGQLTKLVSGSDRGWRGTVAIALAFSGSPEDLSITGTSSIQDFRRYDIFADDALRLAAHCVAHYTSSDRTLHQIICGAPVGDGTVTLQGNMAGLLNPRNYDLTLSAEELPVQALITLARHSKRDLPQDLAAGGILNGSVSVRAADGGTPSMAGDGQITNFRLRSALTRTELEFGDIPLAIANPPNNQGKRSNFAARNIQEKTEAHRLELGPFTLALGRPSPVTIRGWASHSEYSISVQGEAEIKHALQVARTLGLPASQSPAQGMAKLDLQIAGRWSGFSPAKITGTGQLNSVRAQLRGLNAPLEIASATLSLAETEVRLQNLTASVGDSRWAGSLSLPRHCGSPNECSVTFDLHAEELNTDDLSMLFNPHPPKRPWYHLLSSSPQPRPSILREVQASGKLNANRIVLRNLSGKHLSADVQIQNAKVHFSNLRAEILGGKHMGEWQADFKTQPPVYSGTGVFDRVSLDQFAQITHDNWITGTARTNYRLTTSGYTMAELIASSNGSLQFDMSNGALTHIALGTTAAPFHVRRFKARLILVDGQLEIQEGKLDADSGIYQVSGTASLGQNLNIRVVHDGSHAFGITGTVDAPRIVMLSGPETQAALKP